MFNMLNFLEIFKRGTFEAFHDENRMKNEGDVITARADFLQNRFPNLEKLLFNRYHWMNYFLRERELCSKLEIVEIGCGAGFSPLYLEQSPILTDAADNPWVERYIDATNMDLPDSSLDILIASHTMHHFYSPYAFIFEALRVLKPNGFLLIQEINTSLFMKALLYVMKHEGWSYAVDVFDKDVIVNNPNDLWSANCAVPELLFENEKNFIETFQTDAYCFEIKYNHLNECFLFPLSGGVIAKQKVPRLSNNTLNFIEKLDKVLCRIAPKIFALGRSVAIQKRSKNL